MRFKAFQKARARSSPVLLCLARALRNCRRSDQTPTKFIKFVCSVAQHGELDSSSKSVIDTGAIGRRRQDEINGFVFEWNLFGGVERNCNVAVFTQRVI